MWVIGRGWGFWMSDFDRRDMVVFGFFCFRCSGLGGVYICKNFKGIIFLGLLFVM